MINFIPYLSLGTSHKLGNHSAEGKRGGDHHSHDPVSERGHRVQFTDELGAACPKATVAPSDSADAQIVCPLISRGYRQRGGATGHRYGGSPGRQRANNGAHK